MRLCLLEKETGPDPSCWAEPVCCHDFRVYTCKRALSGGKSPEEAVKSNAVVHADRFHNGFNIHLSPAKVNRHSHLFLFFRIASANRIPEKNQKQFIFDMPDQACDGRMKSWKGRREHLPLKDATGF